MLDHRSAPIDAAPDKLDGNWKPRANAVGWRARGFGKATMGWSLGARVHLGPNHQFLFRETCVWVGWALISIDFLDLFGGCLVLARTSSIHLITRTNKRANFYLLLDAHTLCTFSSNFTNLANTICCTLDMQMLPRG